MNHKYLEEMATGAPIYEIKIMSGETIIAEIMDIDSEDSSFMLYWPLKILDRPDGSFLGRWFISNRDPWIQLPKHQIVAYSECLMDMKTKYTVTIMQFEGKLDQIPDPARDSSYH